MLSLAGLAEKTYETVEKPDTSHMKNWYENLIKPYKNRLNALYTPHAHDTKKHNKV